MVAVRATNSCGTGDWKLSNWTVDDCGGYYMMMTPVPANDIVFLSIVPEEELEPGQVGVKLEQITKEKLESDIIPEYVIEIHHFNRGLMKKLKSQDKHLRISTMNFEPGMYFVIMYMDGKKYKQKLIIER